MASWLHFTDEEIKARSDHLRRTSLHAYLQRDTILSLSTSLADLFTLPFSVVSSGLSCCDSMLREANIGARHIGGFPIGTLTELYGPPLSGKSYILQYAARSFVLKMLSIQQYYETRNRLNKEKIQLHGEEKEGKHMRINGTESRTATKRSRNTDEIVGEVLEWDVYICLCTSQPPQPSSHATQECEQNWWSLLTEKNEWDTEKSTYASEHIHVVSIHHPNDLLDFLSFLDEQLQVDSDNVHNMSKNTKEQHYSAAKSASARVESVSETCETEMSMDRTSAPLFNPDEKRSKNICRKWDSALQTHGSLPNEVMDSDPISSSVLPPRSQVSKKADAGIYLPQSRCGEKMFNGQTGSNKQCEEARNVKMPSCDLDVGEGNKASPCTLSRSYSSGWGRRRRRKSVLLLIDSLSWIWQHPALQGSSDLGNTHPMNWYAAELHRLLRICLQTRFAPLEPESVKIENEPLCTSRNPIQEIMTTAIVTNGCVSQGPFGRSLPYPEKNRAPLTDDSVTYKKNSGSVRPDKAQLIPQAKPLGKEAWWEAPDCQLFLEVVDPHALGDPSTGLTNATGFDLERKLDRETVRYGGSGVNFNDDISGNNYRDGSKDQEARNTLSQIVRKPCFRARLYLTKGGNFHSTCMVPYIYKYH